jgi:hypothetical protein
MVPESLETKLDEGIPRDCKILICSVRSLFSGRIDRVLGRAILGGCAVGATQESEDSRNRDLGKLYKE